MGLTYTFSARQSPWRYHEEIPLDAPIPIANIIVVDYEPSLPSDGAEIPYTEVQRDRAQTVFDMRAQVLIGHRNLSGTAERPMCMLPSHFFYTGLMLTVTRLSAHSTGELQNMSYARHGA